MSEEALSPTSRRKFLAVVGVGAAGVAVAGVAGPKILSGSKSAPAAPAGPDLTSLPSDAAGSLIAVVNDVRSGMVSVLVGENEVVIRDREIVARLATAAKNAKAGS